MPRQSPRPHRAAVTRMLRATGLVHIPEEAPLVELIRSLADEMDEGGSGRVRAEYLSALKDVRRVLNASPGRPRKSSDVQAPVDETIAAAEKTDTDSPAATQNDLANFKEKHGIA